MSLIEQVAAAMKWKRSNAYAAEKLGISLEKYVEIKYDILEQRREERDGINQENNISENDEPSSVKFEENIKDNKAVIEYSGPKEVKTKEDLIRECNIDLEKWEITRMIQNAWGKEGNQNYQVKAWLEPKVLTPTDILKQVIESFNFKYIPQNPVHINTNYTSKTCAVLSLQDIHIGKENIDNIDDIEFSTRKCIENLITRTYSSSNLDKIIFVLGGDLLNVDTYNGTTTSGTLVENSMTALEMYQKAFQLMFWAINYTRQFCNELEVVYIPGNHDRLSSGQLAYSLSQVIQDPNIIWNIHYAERKVITYGNSMICLEHGDVSINKSFFVFATEFAQQWGNSKFRTLYSGHYHKEKKIEYITTDEVSGFTMKILPSLSRADRYHSINKWTNNKRGGIIELHSEQNGPTGYLSYYE